ncbi:beta strand repeat-containing protein [Aureimonas phyllosphaerae]|uniref:Ca2+-binding RTX toxin-like protein n=1 Tax=Aureimonas phyllosphaerae TaxID=1166078 RepID=A0A7W6BUM6_9HYPH|nr:calcium-binding protein [Aureimonas phyllosphaerae]MBB3938329.1 Ca2+-binding RTX toxin-like protein [Aureimonas phyllosphaerae]MBB3962339.1 Ca2+-binding RTX toxin-like protein [Aureimonas phyllosphaerae]SFF60117.1 Hemolysin-type calcium-binding repeat-containing protein [Aureimonas phyllosphaerae]
MAVINGTTNRDILTGTTGADSIYGLEGNDEISGGEGNDTLFGGLGDDLVNGGAGDDVIQDSQGSDTLLGGTGADRITVYSPGSNAQIDAGDGDDTVTYEGGPIAQLQGGVGLDTLSVRVATFADFSADNGFERYDGDFRISGTAEANRLDFSGLTALKPVIDGAGQIRGVTVDAGDGADSVTGTAARDILNGGAGHDTLLGGMGDDALTGGAGNDRLDGGAGNDTLYDAGGDGVNSAYGGQGNDRIELVNATAGGVVDGGDDNDTIIVNGGAAMSIAGGSGNDTISLSNSTTGTERHRVDAGDGDDVVTLNGTSAMDLQGGAGHDTLVLKAATLDQLDAAMGFETLKIDSYGGSSLHGTSAANTIDMGSFALTADSYGVNIKLDAGDDQMVATSLTDRLYGEAGNDTLEGGGGDDIIDGGIDGVVNGTIVQGRDFASYEHASSGVTVDLSIQGSAQNTFGAGTDTLNNIEGLVGSGFADRLTGSAGSDVLIGGAGDDTITGGKGDDRLDGGTGADTYRYAGYSDLSKSGTAVLTSERIVLEAEDRLDLSAFGSLKGLMSTKYQDGVTVLTISSPTLGGPSGQIVIEGDWSFNEIAPGIFERAPPKLNVIGGTDGRDSLFGTAAADEIRGGGGNDNLWGFNGNDRLLGGDGNDQFQGGEGADTMLGGAGNDIFYVEDDGDVVIEAANEGTKDLALSYLKSYTLTDGVEELILFGDNALNGTGNDLANRITGNSAGNTLSGGAGADTLSGNSGADTLHGDAGADKLYGGADNDTIYGGADNDLMDGGAGADLLYGGSGNDTYTIDDLGDRAVEVKPDGSDEGGIDQVNASVSFTLEGFVENLTLTGTTATNGTGNDSANKLIGNSATNVLSGGAGADTLDGGGSADTLSGGAGNDTYFVEDIGDRVIEARADGSDEGGIDQVNATVSFALGNFVENLTLAGTAAIDGTGNDLANKLIGNAAANTLTGGGGADILLGGGGSDLLQGGADNDMLDGGWGADMLYGGAGNDTYTVDDLGDRVIEAKADGSDEGGIEQVYTSVSSALGDFLENLSLVGTAAIDGTGNDLANKLIGNSAGNTLTAGGGADTLTGNGGADTLYGDAGADKLYGGSENDTLYGGADNDALDGGTGADKLYGGAGSDTYTVDDVGDQVIEATSSGTDEGGTEQVNASVSFTLGSFVENLTLTGTAAINGTGNELANKLTGNAAANTLTGGAGTDTLIGGAGADTLIGGAGKDVLTGGLDADIFVFGNGGSTSADAVTDFSATQGDKIGLMASQFGLSSGQGIDANGKLSADWFTQVTGTTNTSTASGHGQFLFNSTSKTLFWDADGSGGQGPVAITTLNVSSFSADNVQILTSDFAMI